jgi:shikimate kinase/3-dehydroquinate synthase
VRFDELHAARRTIYEGCARAHLPAGDRDMVRRALPALTALADGSAPAGTRLVWARAASAEYPVFFGRGLLASGFFPTEGERFVVTDEEVQRAVPVPAGWEMAPDRVVAIPPGERSKTLSQSEAVLSAMARGGLDRDGVVVALGGGVVGDLAGFCAATYQRGIRCVQAPTTLVAQVDSALGGKTGVDLPEAKNYVGAYHQPAAVLVDPAALDTLPEPEAAAGYAEVVKTALIAGGGLWARVREGARPDDQIVLACVRTKLEVVAEDERDDGRRQVLNLGHTVAHAIESATGYERFRHGEAVGLGLLCALRLSGRDALREEVRRLLEARGLPVRAEGMDPGEIIALVERDKKRRGGSVPFVLIEAPGEVTPGHEVGEADLRAAVEEVCE